MIFVLRQNLRFFVLALGLTLSFSLVSQADGEDATLLIQFMDHIAPRSIVQKASEGGGAEEWTGRRIFEGRNCRIKFFIDDQIGAYRKIYSVMVTEFTDSTKAKLKQRLSANILVNTTNEKIENTARNYDAVIPVSDFIFNDQVFSFSSSFTVKTSLEKSPRNHVTVDKIGDTVLKALITSSTGEAASCDLR